jgi:signal transduction histidine kinase/CheY-like chemotaxis protein
MASHKSALKTASYACALKRARERVSQLLSKRSAIGLTITVTTLFAVGDFVAPGELNVSIFYALSVALAGRVRSRQFLWGITGICVLLAFAGLAVGPQPSAPVLLDMYINRSFVALGLAMVAAIVHQRIRILERLEQARDLQRRQNESLLDAETELRRVNEELEHRVDREVQRRLEVEQELHQAQKMEAIGQLTGGVAHDFNNLLTIVIGNLELIVARSSIDESCRRLAETALHGAEDGSRLTQQLLSFARRGRLDSETLAIERVLDAVMALARRAIGETIEVFIEVGDDLWSCCADQAQLRSALLNLVINARDAMPEGGRVVIAARNVTFGEDAVDLARGEYVHITVQDTGAGMPPDVVNRAFEPFFTTKEIGKGSGLGLSMVYGFAKQSGGTVRIESAPNCGTTVHLYLPRTTLSSVAEPAPERPIPFQKKSATILVVEDEPGVRQLTAESLEGCGYRVMQAADARAAVPMLERETIDLLVSDIVMPGGMSGLDLAEEVRHRYRNLPVLLTTGYAEAIDRVTAQGQRFELLQKPFRPKDLTAKIHQMLNMGGERQSA